MTETPPSVESAPFGPGERTFLAIVAAFGLVVVNGAFLYSLAARPDALESALRNPLAAAFIVEALVLVGVLAWLLRRNGWSRLSWGWFVVLSLLGSLAFALPVAILWGRGGRTRESR
jgi:hypothetical protein